MRVCGDAAQASDAVLIRLPISTRTASRRGLASLSTLRSAKGGALTEAQRQRALMIAGEQKDVRVRGCHGLARRLRIHISISHRKVGPRIWGRRGSCPHGSCMGLCRADIARGRDARPPHVRGCIQCQVRWTTCGGRPQSPCAARLAKWGSWAASPACPPAQSEVLSSSKP